MPGWDAGIQVDRLLRYAADATNQPCCSCLQHGSHIICHLLAPAPSTVQTCTKVAGGWGFMVAAVAFYDGTASLMKVGQLHACAAPLTVCYCPTYVHPVARHHARQVSSFSATAPCSCPPSPCPQDVYGKQILPVFPLKPVNKVSLGDFGTKRFVDVEQGKRAA